MYDSASVQFVRAERDQLILSCAPVVEQEARKVAHRCQWLSASDLYAQAMLYVVERARYVAEAHNPGGYVRQMVGRYLRQYVYEYDGLIRTPNAHRPGRHAEPFGCASLDAALGSGSETCTLEGLLAAPGAEGDGVEHEELRQALLELPELERRAFLLRFLSKSCQRVCSWRVISKELGVSAREARELVDAALVCLRYELTGRPVL